MSERKRKPAPPRLLSDERRRKIVEWVAQHGRATVEELSRHYGVSAVTIRTDLEALARAGTLSRSHGGALPRETAVADEPVNAKAMRHHAQKRRIAQAAARLIGDGDTIILDSGSTTAEIARQIPALKLSTLTVITNALNIALELASVPQVRLIMLGGLLRAPSRSLVGPDAEQALARLHADRLFLGVDGIDAHAGITTPDPFEASLNAGMIRSARETVVVADASKLGRRSLSVIAPIDGVQRLITDAGAAKEHLAELRALGLDVQVV